MQRAIDSVLLTLILILAVDDRSEGFVGDVLESFGSTDIAGVGIDLEEWLDFGNTCNNSAYCDEVAEVGSANVPNGENLVAFKRLEEDVAFEIVRIEIQKKSTKNALSSE